MIEPRNTCIVAIDWHSTIFEIIILNHSIDPFKLHSFQFHCLKFMFSEIPVESSEIGWIAIGKQGDAHYCI